MPRARNFNDRPQLPFALNQIQIEEFPRSRVNSDRRRRDILLAKGQTRMPRYMIVYLGGEKPSSPEEGKRRYVKYKAWLSSLGAAAVSPMNPLKETRTINSDRAVTEGSAVAMSGYTIIEARSIDGAVSIAKACPYLETGGSLEVSELMQAPAGN